LLPFYVQFVFLGHIVSLQLLFPQRDNKLGRKGEKGCVEGLNSLTVRLLAVLTVAFVQCPMMCSVACISFVPVKLFFYQSRKHEIEQGGSVFQDQYFLPQVKDNIISLICERKFTFIKSRA
jgi:hypothetical protein